jgi:hypothetical protein
MTARFSEVTTTKVYYKFNMFLGACLLGLTVILFLNDQVFWSVVSLGGGILMLTIPSRIDSATCPACRGKIAGLPAFTSYFECKSCNSPLWNRKKDKRIEQADESFVANEPFFKWVLPWNGFDLPGVTEAYGVVEVLSMKTTGTERLDAKWPDGCCVCGAAVDHRQDISKKFRVTPGGGMIRSTISRDVNVLVNDIPYCSIHANGIELRIGANDFGASNGFLAFRSLRYFRAFRQLNKEQPA